MRETERKGGTMAICQIVENPEQSQEQAEQVLSHVRNPGPSHPKAPA